MITSENIAASLVLPTLTLAIAMAAKYIRQIRAAVLEELNKDYVTGARARGVRGSVIIWKNVLRASMLTIVTLMALSVGSLLGGTTIVESIFMWDGVGKMAVDAITMRDYPVVQVYVAWMAVIYVAVNLITDIVYHYLDPRVRLGGEQGWTKEKERFIFCVQDGNRFCKNTAYCADSSGSAASFNSSVCKIHLSL